MKLIRPRGEQGAMDDVVEVLDSVVDKLDVINPEMSFYLAVRHGRDFRTILWGAIPNEIKSMLNREKLEALMTQKVLETIKKKVTGPAETALRDVPAEPDISPRLLEDVELTQSEIQQLAHEMENVVTSAEAALKDSLQTQAVDFVKRLEEDHFFSQYYSPVPGKALLSEIVRNIDSLLADPALIPISRSALEMIKGEVEEAKGLQDQLHKNGLKKERFLNLYQILGIQKMLTMKKVLLGDEMGLGKTLQTLCAFLMSGKNEMVVVAPRKALGRWLEDIHKHLSAPLDVVILANVEPPAQLLAMENVSVHRIVDPEERMAYLTNARGPPAVGRKRIIVTNFELLPSLGLYLRKNDMTKMSGFSTGFVAIDEVHLVKNKNQTSDTLLGRPEVGGSALIGDYRVAISGTPLENAPIDLLAILRWLSLGGESEAEEFFAGLTPAQFKKVFQKADLEKLSRLSAYLAQHMIRRLKGHVMRDLPEKRYVSVSLSPFFREMRLSGGVPISLPGNYNRQISMYDWVLSNYPAFERVYRGVSLEEESDDVAVPGSAQILRLEQVTMTPDIFRDQDDPAPIDSIKIDAMVSLANKHLDSGEYVTVMSDHLLAIRAAKDALLKAGVPEDDISMFHGEMSQVEQERNRERFQNGKARIILCTRQSAGTSIELTRTDAMIFLNTPWTPASLDQAVDRVHRQDSEGRHKEGKEITIYILAVDFPISIDSLKINLIRLKRAFGEMLVNGNLTPEILETFENAAGGPIAAIRESMQSREAPLSYERKLFNEFHFLLGRAIQSQDPEMKRQLWEKISDIYHLILFHKATFFANQANLDHLSGDGFPELKRRLVKVLDLGSGPSVLYHAYDQSREKMKGRGLQLQISEFDASAAMLARGVVRPGEQTVGSFSHLGEAYPANTFDVVNMSYSFELADHPARLIKTIHSLLKGNGLFALILPKDTLIPEAFYRGLEAAGFKLRTVQGGQLESKIPETHYRELVREYGEEFAKDIARTAHTRHTYLLAEKTTNGEELSDDFFRIGLSREKMDIEKIKRLRSTEARFGVVPPDLPIEGIVDYDPSKRRDEETLSRWLLGDKIRGHISSMIQLADKLSRQSPDSKERPKILTQLRQKLLLLKNEVELADINNPQRLAILHLFQKGLHNKFFDQWVKHDGKEYLDLMVLLQGGMNDTNGEILPRKRAGGNKTGGTKGRATSQWGLKMAEWIGSKVDPIHGRERFGARYKQFAAAIEWIFGAKVALWGFVATLAFAGAPMGWVLAPAVGVVYGILFVASHFIPKSMAPVTKVNVGMLETVAMGLIYGVLIGATPFLLGAVPLLGVPEFGVQAAAIVWGLAGFLHYLIDKKKESEAKTSPEKPSFTKWEIISPFVGPLFLFFSYVRFMDTDTKTSWAYKIFDFPWFQSINNGYINDLISIPTVWALFFTVASVVNILIKIFKNFFEKKPTHMDRSILGDVAKRKDKITSIVFEAGVFFSLMIGGLLAFNEANSRLFDAMRLLYHSLSDFDGVYRAGVYGGGDILSFLRMFSGTFDPVDLMIFAFEGAASFSFIPVLFYFLPAFRSTVEASQKRRQSPLVSLIATLLKWDALKLNNSKDTIQSPGTDYPRISGIVLKVAIVTIVLGSVAFVWSIASPWVEIPFFEVPKIDAHSATILGAAGFVQGFVPKTPKEAGEQAAWALVAQSANIQGALESVMPVVQNDHMGSIVGEGSSSTDSLSTVLVEIKNDADFRDGFVGVIRTAMEQGNLSPMQMNLLPVLIKGATGQPVAFLHILGKTPKNELATLESLVERTDPNEKSGLSVALVVPAGQTEAVEARIAALKSQGVQVFHVPLRSEGWTGDDLRSLEDQMSTWLEKTNGIMATVGTKVGINPKDIEALNKESKLREALKSAVTLGETIQTFLRYLQALASNA